MRAQNSYRDGMNVPQSAKFSRHMVTPPLLSTSRSLKRKVHTPQNSTITIDSTAATIDDVVSPKQRRKAIHMNEPQRPIIHPPDDSGGDSPASPLSDALNPFRRQQQQQQQVLHQLNQFNKAEMESTTDSIVYAPFKEDEELNRIQKYKEQLKKLNNLLPPMSLFHDTDVMIRNYQKLKKEYCLQWELQQLYRSQIRSFLKPKTRAQSNVHGNNRQSDIPLTEVESLIQRLQSIQFSIMEIFANFLKRSRKGTIDIIHQQLENQHSNSKEHNIKPSHAKRLSNGEMSVEALKKRSKSKYQKQKKRASKVGKLPKIHRKKSKRHRQKQHGKYGKTDPNFQPPQELRLRRATSAIEKHVDGGNRPHHHQNNHHSHHPHHNYQHNRIGNDHHALTVTQYDTMQEYMSPDVIDSYQHRLALDPPITTRSTLSNPYSNNVLVLPRHLSKNKRSRRRSSVRSFGTLYSNQFRNDVAENYRTSMALDDEYKLEGCDKARVVQFYHDNYIGQNELFESPFGIRPIIYCDWTASGKSLQCVEDYIKQEMLTLYGNTHTTTSITGIQTSSLRSEARSIILESLNGDHHQDVVIFTGSGTTAAIDKIAHVLMKSFDKNYRPEKTIVFISVFEHNSNIYIWKELGCKIIVIPETRHKKKGGINMKELEQHLQFYTSAHMKHKYNLLIGSFTAASNVSGILLPIDDITALLHGYGALAFWDYATAGPYIHVNMTNLQNPLLSKDAVFLSAHKYLAGPGSPGILCAKKRLFQNYIPVVPGGGTVFVAYGVEDGQWEYLENIEEREEGGTPDIIGSVRASFAFMVKDHITTEFIQQRENEYLEYFWNECKSINNLIIMGNTECDRLPVISFLITHTKRGFGASQKTKYLHYNFVAALMNDLFGIQGRGGCACAGMYGKYVLGLQHQEVDHVVHQLRDSKNELARPGFYRINLHYTLTQQELEYIVSAIKYVCKKGWLFVPLYDVDVETGNYFHRDIKHKPMLLKNQLRSLLDIEFDKKTGNMLWKRKHIRINDKSLKRNYSRFFEMADDIVENLNKYLPSVEEFHSEQKICDDSAWYWLPSELYQDARKYAL